MSTQTPNGWTTSREYFKLSDKDSEDSDSDSDSDESLTGTETESEFEYGSELGSEENTKMLKGYLKNTKRYKKILFEDDLFPE
jgi:hypothetical protein